MVEKQDDLRKRVAYLERLVARLQGDDGEVVEPTDPKDRQDYIAYGSPEHAAMLGLREADEADVIVKEVNGHKWALVDITRYGPAAREEFLLRVLDQKVNELLTPPAVPQSHDRRAPDFAPARWRPGRQLSQIEE